MKKNMTPDLIIIILNYNGQQWLELTLKTLKQFYLDLTQYSVKVRVVDNASTDSSVETVKNKYPWVELLALKSNDGFAAGNNVALRKIQSRYVMLLNSDVESTVNSNLDELITYLDDNPQIGVVTPQLSLANGKLDLACHRGEPTLWAALTYFSGLEKLFPKIALFSQYHQLYKNMQKTHTIDACSGAAMVVRKTAIDQVGLLDDRFFMYAEDLDWCHRFRQNGYDVIYYPQVCLIHHKNKSGIGSKKEQVVVQTNHYFYDTMLQYYDKYYATRYPNWVRSFVSQIIQIKKSRSKYHKRDGPEQSSGRSSI